MVIIGDECIVSNQEYVCTPTCMYMCNINVATECNIFTDLPFLGDLPPKKVSQSLLDNMSTITHLMVFDQLP